MSVNESLLVDKVRATVAAVSLSPRYWAVGELADDRCCLLFHQDHWIAGYFERGEFTVEFTESDTDTAVARFVSWVAKIQDSTEKSVRATERWLREQGKGRP